MNDNKLNNSLINPLPPIILVITLFLILIELIFQLSETRIIFGGVGPGLRNNIITQYAFYGSLQDWMISNSALRWELLIRYISYLFIHLSFLHTLIATVMFLALGKMVCEFYNGLLFFFTDYSVVNVWGFFLWLNFG